MRFPSVLLLCGLLAVAPSLYARQTASAPAQTTTTAPAQTAPAKAPAQTTTKPSTPPLRLESLPPLPHALTPQQQRALRNKQLLDTINKLARNQANWGPASSTPGASLRLLNKGSKPSPEGTQVTFTLHATGFKPGDSITLFRWPLGSNVQQVATGLTVDATGQVICPEISQGDCLASMQPGDPVLVKDVAARGEPLRVAIGTPHGRIRAEVTIVPYPLIATSNTCKMEVLLGAKNASLVLLEAIGFPSSKQIEIHVVTHGKDTPLTTTTTARGEFIAGVITPIPGYKSGTTTISIKDPSCSPSISFPWGIGSYHPL